MTKWAGFIVAGTFMAASLGVAFGQPSTAPTAPGVPAPEKKAEKTHEKRMRSKTVHGKVKSASADGLVVAGKAKGKDTEWTFALDPETKIRKGGKDVTAADLKEGDSVQIRFMEHAGKLVAQAVMARAVPKADARPEGKADKKQ